MIKNGQLAIGNGELLNEVVEIKGYGFNLYDNKTKSVPVIIVKTKSGAEHRVEICEENAELFPCEYADSAKKNGIKNKVGKHHQNEVWDEKLNKFVPKTEDNCPKH